MRYAVIALLVGGVLIAGCGLGDRVELLTGGNGACYAGGGEGTPGRLVAEGEYGTTYNGQPVMWPDGYIGRRAGAEVEVLDADGDVRATTGRFYRIMLRRTFRRKLSALGRSVPRLIAATRGTSSTLGRRRLHRSRENHHRPHDRASGHTRRVISRQG